MIYLDIKDEQGITWHIKATVTPGEAPQYGYSLEDSYPGAAPEIETFEAEAEAEAEAETDTVHVDTLDTFVEAFDGTLTELDVIDAIIEKGE